MVYAIRRLCAVAVLCFIGVTHTATANDKATFSGFARLVAGSTFDEDKSYEGYDDDFDFRPDSIIGLQLDYQISDTLSATAQVIGTRQPFDNDGLEWLYLDYRPGAAWSFKFGQLRTPFFSYSDVKDVGYAYHWIKPPTEVYASFFFSHFDGVEASYHNVSEHLTWKLEGYLGRYSEEVEYEGGLIDTEIDKYGGLIASVDLTPFSARVAYSRGEVYLAEQNILQLEAALLQLGQFDAAKAISFDDVIEYWQVGLAYEQFDYFVRAEWISVLHDLKLLADLESYYVSAGHQLDDLLFHFTFAHSSASKNGAFPELSLPATPDFLPLILIYQAIESTVLSPEQNAFTLGVRWDFREDMAFKTEVKHFKIKATDDDTTALLFALEWVF